MRAEHGDADVVDILHSFAEGVAKRSSTPGTALAAPRPITPRAAGDAPMPEPCLSSAC